MVLNLVEDCRRNSVVVTGTPTGPGRGPFWPGPAWRATAARPRPGPARLRRAGLASWPGPARQRRAATAWAAKTTCTKFMPLSNLKKSGIIFANWLNQSNHCKVIIFIFWTTNKLRVVGQSRRSLSLVRRLPSAHSTVLAPHFLRIARQPTFQSSNPRALRFIIGLP